jgi:uncharacterized protein YdeI (YjbR/CyaY-like superfamily)
MVHSKPAAELPIIAFETQAAFRTWLMDHQQQLECIWIRFFKKNSGVKTITYDQALDEALCFGWIDSQVKKYDEQSYIQKFTPRRPKGLWSKRNIEHIGRLTKAGLMQPAGLKEVEAAKADGRWQQAYDPPSQMQIPEEFLKELAKNPQAETFFQTLNKTNRYSIAWKLQTAKKPETRTKRIETIVNMLAKGEKLY